LLFGTFEPNEQISEYLKGITISFPSETDESTLDLPGIGSFEPSGLGVLILNQLEDRLAFVVLADVEENLISLTDLLSSGSLFGCFTTDTLALCKVGVGCFTTDTLALCKVGETDSSSFDFDFETDFNIVDDFPEAEG
jgi:hypothetical protein